MNNSGSHSEYFEELCALAASGQISEPEFVELSDHMRSCSRCRSAYEDFTDLLHNKLPLADPELTGPFKPSRRSREGSSYRERFLTRARKEGLAVSRGALGGSPEKRPGWWPFLRLSYAIAPLAMALLVVTAGILGYAWRQSNARNTRLAAELAAISAQIRPSERAEIAPAKESRPEERSLSLDTVREPSLALPRSMATDTDLVQVRHDHEDAAARANALQEQLQAATLELQASRGQFEQLSGYRNQLAARLTDAERVIAQVQGELQSARENRSRDTSSMAIQSARIQDLSERLRIQTEILDRETTLLAAGRDIHDLMGARNLHIVDVHDNDTKGKESKTFGRVFYTEGKSLIFYAFDLADLAPKKRDASFQVWGTREPGKAAPRSLGLLYVDDQKQKRWVLRFEDPAVLAEIDSVFVTVEPQGGSPKPTSDKLLYAYLVGEPNHP